MGVVALQKITFNVPKSTPRVIFLERLAPTAK